MSYVSLALFYIFLSVTCLFSYKLTCALLVTIHDVSLFHNFSEYLIVCEIVI